MALQRQNFGKRQVWYPTVAVYPKSLEQLRKSILTSVKNKRKMRAIGSLHTFNALCATQGTQIHTDYLCQILGLDLDKQTVKVEGGIKIKSLLHILAKEGLTLPNQGYIVEQSIAGAIATATHGSGKTGTMSSFVLELELIDAKGVLHILNPKYNQHLFSAAVVSLGCLGVVYSVTLQCNPLEKLKLKKVLSRVPLILNHLPARLQDHDHFQFAIDPYSDDVLTWGYQVTQTGFYNEFLYGVHRLVLKSLAQLTFDLLPTPSRILPKLLNMYMFMSPFASCVGHSYKLLSPGEEGHYVEEEIGVPFEYFAKALEAVREIINQYSKRDIRMVAIILVRFVESDPYGYLSPTHGRKTVYISLISIAKDGYRDLFRDVEEALYSFQGRPHWGKVHHLTAEKIAELYGEDYVCFKEARIELDPEGWFLNEETERLFFI